MGTVQLFDFASSTLGCELDAGAALALACLRAISLSMYDDLAVPVIDHVAPLYAPAPLSHSSPEVVSLSPECPHVAHLDGEVVERVVGCLYDLARAAAVVDS